MEGEAFKNTSWVNHFETQSIEIGGLNNELYEFKTVGRNDYPDNNVVNSRSESPASDVTEGRPLRSTTSKYRTSLSEENATILPWSLLVLKGFRHARFTTTISVKSGDKALSKVN